MGFGNASSSRLFDELVLNHLAMQLIMLQRPSLDGQRRNWHSSGGGGSKFSLNLHSYPLLAFAFSEGQQNHSRPSPTPEPVCS